MDCNKAYICSYF